MAHPGWFDDDLAYSRYARQREVELIGLGTAAARAAAGALGIRLCHFGDLSTDGHERGTSSGPASRLRGS
jgi:predicted glycoside hydrolase/deacetylase ChbG (UPF0249 family)